MRRRSVTTAVCLALLSGGLAGWCFQEKEALRTEGEWLLARSNARADEYVRTLEDARAREMLETLARRRRVLERAYPWQVGQELGVVVAVLAGLYAWGLAVLRRLAVPLDAPEAPAPEAPSAGSLSVPLVLREPQR